MNIIFFSHSCYMDNSSGAAVRRKRGQNYLSCLLLLSCVFWGLCHDPCDLSVIASSTTSSTAATTAPPSSTPTATTPPSSTPSATSSVPAPSSSTATASCPGQEKGSERFVWTYLIVLTPFPANFMLSLVPFRSDPFFGRPLFRPARSCRSRLRMVSIR